MSARAELLTRLRDELEHAECDSSCSRKSFEEEAMREVLKLADAMVSAERERCAALVMAERDKELYGMLYYDSRKQTHKVLTALAAEIRRGAEHE